MKNYYMLLFLFTSIDITQTKQRNVLFVVVDDLRLALGVYGDKNAYTPNIDSLAKRSFVFKNAFCQQALCAPSRNSFLTSRRPDSLHLYDFYSYWRDVAGNFTTLPQYFREQGYFTHSIGKVFHPGLSSNYTDDAKYSWSAKPFHPVTEQYKDAKVCLNRDGSLGANLICPVIVKEQPRGTLPDIEILHAAIAFLKSHQERCRGQPFFLAVGFHKPHIPFKFPVEYLKFHPLNKIRVPKNHWRSPTMPTVAWNPWTDVREREDVDKLNISFPFGEMPMNMTREITQAYSASVTYVDDLIGSLLQQIDENTIIVLFGDHGWSMGEHAEFAKYSNYDTATRVPLIIQVPGMVRMMTVVEELVELVDLFPTLVDLTQITPSIETCTAASDEIKSKQVCTEGRSLVPVMVSALQKSNYTEKDAVFMQYPRPGTFPTLTPNSDKPRLKHIRIMGYSIRTKTHRYTEWIGFNPKKLRPNWKRVYARELYDHTLDSQESLNLAERPELCHLIEYFNRRLREGWRRAFVSNCN